MLQLKGPQLHILYSFLFFLILLPESYALAAASSVNDDLAASFRVMWGLLIVLAIILVLYALFRKRFSILNQRRPGKAIHVLEIQPLMPRKSLCLVEVKGKEYLLGVGNESISLLAALDDDPQNAKINEERSFNEVLNDSQARRES